jgi:nicotinamidase-related amidase
MARVEQTARYLVRAAKILDIPVIATEHNIKAFGPILESIKADVDPNNSAWFHKFKFSMMTDEVEAYLKSKHPQRNSVVLFGIETHVCVQQTSLDLLERNFNLHLAVDGVSSQRAHDRTVAIERIKNAGGFLTTSESIVFELMKDGKHPKFKDLLPLAKEKRVSEFERL